MYLSLWLQYPRILRLIRVSVALVLRTVQDNMKLWITAELEAV